MSVKQLIEKIEVSEGGFYKMFKNDSLKVSTLMRISEALSVNMEYWFREDITKEPENKAISAPRYNYDTECTRRLLMAQDKIIELQDQLNKIITPSLNEPGTKYKTTNKH